MKDKPELDEKQELAAQNQEQDEEDELSLEDLEDVSGSAANPRPRERGDSRRSSGF